MFGQTFSKEYILLAGSVLLILSIVMSRVSARFGERMAPYNSSVVGRAIFELGFPSDVLVTLVCRDEKFIIAAGKTVLEGGDVLLVLGDQAALKKNQEILARGQS